MQPIKNKSMKTKTINDESMVKRGMFNMCKRPVGKGIRNYAYTKIRSLRYLRDELPESFEDQIDRGYDNNASWIPPLTSIAPGMTKMIGSEIVWIGVPFE